MAKGQRALWWPRGEGRCICIGFSKLSVAKNDDDNRFECNAASVLTHKQRSKRSSKMSQRVGNELVCVCVCQRLSELIPPSSHNTNSYLQFTDNNYRLLS